MQITDDRVSSLGNNVRLFINVDREDVFGSHGTHPVLDRTGDAAGKVNIRRNARASLAHLVCVIAPATDVALACTLPSIDNKSEI